MFSRGRKTLLTRCSAAVAGMSCIRPRAPFGETARRSKSDSAPAREGRLRIPRPFPVGHRRGHQEPGPEQHDSTSPTRHEGALYHTRGTRRPEKSAGPRGDPQDGTKPPPGNRARDRSFQYLQLSHCGRSDLRTIGTAMATTFRFGLSDRATPSMVTIALLRSVAERGRERAWRYATLNSSLTRVS